jgi:uncharacterized zinc-type alcohol dehydrogenase-like protein
MARRPRLTHAHGYAALVEGGILEPFDFERRDPTPYDIVIDIHYCGICHTDVNAIRNVRRNYSYPLVPGHEIVGKVVHAGEHVHRFKVGDWAGVGTITDSCRMCGHCGEGLEPYCREGMTGTYGVRDRQGRMTYGGFSSNYVIDAAYAFRIPAGLDPAKAAPLLCAGITTYSPLRRAGIAQGWKVGVIGLGGLGHMAVKWAKLFGAHVVVLTTTFGKVADARRLGADEAVLSSDANVMHAQAGTFDFILDTVSGNHDINAYIRLLKLDGELCLVGIPEKPFDVSPVLLASGRRSMSGSMIGGLAETEEMLELAACAGVACDIEIIGVEQINDALERLGRGDVRYRFVIDMKKKIQNL